MADKFGWDNNFGNNPAPTARQKRIREERKMAAKQEKAFQEYLDSQSDPALVRLELANDRGRADFDPEAYDEMVRHDMEGKS